MLWNAPLKEKPPPGTAYPGHMMAWDAYTGELSWKTSWAVVGQEAATPCCYFAAAYGKVFMGSYDGNFYCIDENTGEVLWWREGIGGMTGNGPQVADGIVYEGGTTWRMFVPATIYALNATTGETVWSYDVPSPPRRNGAVADGRYYQGTTDGLFYCFGCGPTATTLELSTKQLHAGQKVLVSGLVLDKSPASPDAAVADVPVQITYVPLGGTEAYDVATVTTGYAGDYYCEWTVPADVTGTGSLVATCQPRDEAYDVSSATVNFIVESAPAPALTKEDVAEQVYNVLPPPRDYTLVLMVVVALVVVAVVLGLYNTLTIKKLRSR
jgi:hypothetical protein